MNHATATSRILCCGLALGVLCACAPIPTQQTAVTEKDIQERFDDLPGILHELCREPRLSAYYKKTPCLPHMATPQQLKDEKTITIEEAIAMNHALKALADINAETRRLMVESKLESYVEEAKKAEESFDPLAKENQQALINAEITWGEYNRRRLELQQSPEETP